MGFILDSLWFLESIISTDEKIPVDAKIRHCKLEKTYKATTLNKNYKKLINAESERNSFPRDEYMNWLSNTK